MVNILFASNNVADWTGAPGTDATSGRFDSARVPYGIQIPDNAVVGMAAMHPAPVGDTVWYGFHFYQESSAAGNEDGYVVKVYDDSGNLVAAINLLNGEWIAQAVGDTTVSGVGYLMSLAGATTNVGLQVQVNTTGITVSLYVGGTQVSTATAANSGGKGVARRFVFDIYDAFASSTPSVFSEFVVAESDTSAMRVTRLDPAAAGNYSQWTGAVASLGDDDATTGVSTDTAAQRNSATFDALTGGGVISAVVGVATAAADAGAPQSLTQFLRKGAIDYDGSASPLSLSNSFAVECWDVDPSTGAAWADAAAVNACEIGLLSVA